MEIEDQEDQFPTHSFVQDNTSVHTANDTKDFFEENLVKVFQRPSNSPDLNIMEGFWSYVKSELCPIRDQLIYSEDTWEKALQIWGRIPLTYIQDLYDDLPIRMKELKIMRSTS